MKKTKSESLQTYQQLLDAALEIFWRNGVTRATLQQIAEEAGVTRGALYWHFKNKEDLFEALCERHYAAFQQRFQEEKLNKAPDVWQYLHESMLDLFLRLESDAAQRKFCEIMHYKCEHTESNQTINALVNRYNRFCDERVNRALQLCYEQGRLPENSDMELTSVYLKSSFIGLLHRWLERPQEFGIKGTAEKIIDAALETIQRGAFVTHRAAK